MSKNVHKIKEPLVGFFPTPVVLVSSVDEAGKPNVCTVAWIGVVASSPPQLGIALRKSRLSRTLVVKSKEVVVNLPTEDLLSAVDYCGLVSGRKVDKFAELGLSTERALHVRAPLIKECPVNIECKVKSVVKAGSHDFIIARILAIHVDERIEMTGMKRIDVEKVRPIVFCLDEYWSLGSCIGRIGLSKARKKRPTSKELRTKKHKTLAKHWV